MPYRTGTLFCWSLTVGADALIGPRGETVGFWIRGGKRGRCSTYYRVDLGIGPYGLPSSV